MTCDGDDQHFGLNTTAAPAAIAEEKNTMVPGRSDKFQREQKPRRNTTYKLRSHGPSVRQMDPSQYLARKV